MLLTFAGGPRTNFSSSACLAIHLLHCVEVNFVSAVQVVYNGRAILSLPPAARTQTGHSNLTKASEEALGEENEHQAFQHRLVPLFSLHVGKRHARCSCLHFHILNFLTLSAANTTRLWRHLDGPLLHPKATLSETSGFGALLRHCTLLCSFSQPAMERIKSLSSLVVVALPSFQVAHKLPYDLGALKSLRVTMRLAIRVQHSRFLTHSVPSRPGHIKGCQHLQSRGMYSPRDVSESLARQFDAYNLLISSTEPVTPLSGEHCCFNASLSMVRASFSTFRASTSDSNWSFATVRV